MVFIASCMIIVSKWNEGPLKQSSVSSVQSDKTATSYLHRIHRRIRWARFGTSCNNRLKRIAKRGMAPIYWHLQPTLQAISEVRSRHRSVKTDDGVGLLARLVGCIAFAHAFRVGPCVRGAIFLFAISGPAFSRIGRTRCNLDTQWSNAAFKLVPRFREAFDRLSQTR